MSVPTDASVLPNLCDLGGLEAAGGRATRHGVLYRSDAPPACDAAPDTVAARPPATVVDLRAPSKRGATHPLGQRGSRVPALPLLDDEDLSILVKEYRSRADTPGTAVWHGSRYDRGMQRRGTRFAMAANVVARARPPVLVHCSAGRDRTGILIALLLAAAGVRPEAIERTVDRAAIRPDGAAGWLVDNGAEAEAVAAWTDRLLTPPR